MANFWTKYRIQQDLNVSATRQMHSNACPAKVNGHSPTTGEWYYLWDLDHIGFIAEFDS